MKSFLTAHWRRLLIANYAIDPDVLRNHLPAGTELDFWQGRCYVSVVGFMFQDTRLRGISMPLHRDFEEVNLRFYVRRLDPDNGSWRRGVVFIREFVPKAALTWVANAFYGEHYSTVPMRHEWLETGSGLNVKYEWKCGGRWNSITALARMEATKIEVGSEEEFITEHYWGYTRLGDRSTDEYEVRHPRWQVHGLNISNVDVDFPKCYGADFAHLVGIQPTSMMLAEGSAVSVFSRTVF